MNRRMITGTRPPRTAEQKPYTTRYMVPTPQAKKQPLKFAPRTISATPLENSNTYISAPISYNEIGQTKSMDDYLVGKILGQGAYAVVRLSIHKPTGRKLAIK